MKFKHLRLDTRGTSLQYITSKTKFCKLPAAFRYSWARSKLKGGRTKINWIKRKNFETSENWLVKIWCFKNFTESKKFHSFKHWIFSSIKKMIQKVPKYSRIMSAKVTGRQTSHDETWTRPLPLPSSYAAGKNKSSIFIQPALSEVRRWYGFSKKSSQNRS